MKAVTTTAAPAAIGPYSQAMISGNLVFTSGLLPLCPESGQVVGESVTEQTEQVCKNLKALLEASGSSIDKIVKANCYLVDMNEFAAFNEVYAKYITGKPARATVAVRGLAKNTLVEIEAVAEI